MNSNSVKIQKMNKCQAIKIDQREIIDQWLAEKQNNLDIERYYSTSDEYYSDANLILASMQNNTNETGRQFNYFMAFIGFICGIITIYFCVIFLLEINELENWIYERDQYIQTNVQRELDNHRSEFLGNWHKAEYIMELELKYREIYDNNELCKKYELNK